MTENALKGKLQLAVRGSLSATRMNADRPL